MMAVYVPERDQSIDILEMIEYPHFIKFHQQTLRLYCALAAQGNQKVAHILCKHVDESQLMFAISSHCKLYLKRSHFCPNQASVLSDCKQ